MYNCTYFGVLMTLYLTFIPDSPFCISLSSQGWIRSVSSSGRCRLDQTSSHICSCWRLICCMMLRSMVNIAGWRSSRISSFVNAPTCDNTGPDKVNGGGGLFPRSICILLNISRFRAETSSCCFIMSAIVSRCCDIELALPPAFSYYKRTMHTCAISRACSALAVLISASSLS